MNVTSLDVEISDLVPGRLYYAQGYNTFNKADSLPTERIDFRTSKYFVTLSPKFEYLSDSDGSF